MKRIFGSPHQHPRTRRWSASEEDVEHAKLMRVFQGTRPVDMAHLSPEAQNRAEFAAQCCAARGYGTRCDWRVARALVALEIAPVVHLWLRGHYEKTGAKHRSSLTDTAQFKARKEWNACLDTGGIIL